MPNTPLVKYIGFLLAFFRNRMGSCWFIWVSRSYAVSCFYSVETILQNLGINWWSINPQRPTRYKEYYSRNLC